MKKFYSFLAAGLMLTACSSEKLAGPETGTEQEVVLSFQLPETINARATGTNSALGGASNCSGDITFTAALYYNGTEIWRDDATAAIPNANAAVTFKPTLVIGEKYQLVAYAQMDGAISDLTKQVEANAINDESVDAYYVSTELVAEPTMSATLKRATAKLRIIAEDFAAAEKQLNKKVAKVAVTYRQAQATELNPTTGEWATGAETAFGPAELVVYSNETDAKTILVDYIPATAEGEIINIESVVVTFDDNTTYTKDLSKLDVPVKRNWLTTLTGNFFMAETELKVEIDDAFEGEDEKNYGILSAFEFGGEYTLEEDVTINDVLILDGKDLVLNLNGKTINFSGDTRLAKVYNGTLTINGEGTINVNSDNLDASSTAAYIATAYEGGLIVVNGGKHITNGCTLYHTNGGDLLINGGYFEANETGYSQVGKYNYVYTLNVQGNDPTSIVVKGGTFVKYNPAASAGENPVANFVAPGYKSVQNGDSYIVVAENVEVATTADEMTTALSEGKSVTLAANIAISETVKSNAGIVIDGAGYTLALTENTSAQYALQPKGGTIKNLTIEGYNQRNSDGKVLRGIYLTPSESVTIDNVHISGVAYPLNTGSGAVVEGKTLTVTNSTLVGWTSYSGGFVSASFTNCVFATGSFFDATQNPTWNNCIKPYVSTVFTNCAFDKGFNIELSEITEGESIKMVNCTVDDVVITSANVAELLNVTNGSIVF